VRLWRRYRFRHRSRANRWRVFHLLRFPLPLIAAAAAGNGPGDGSNAQLEANLANQPTVAGATPSDYYAGFLANLGSNVQNLQTQVSSVTASLAQLTTQQGSLSGVSQDEEAMNLETYERSYQAASQTFNILDTTLNLGVEDATLS
jgi:flagellar hook-associated protein FlgK